MINAFTYGYDTMRRTKSFGRTSFGTSINLFIVCCFNTICVRVYTYIYIHTVGRFVRYTQWTDCEIRTNSFSIGLHLIEKRIDGLYIYILYNHNIKQDSCCIQSSVITFKYKRQ